MRVKKISAFIMAVMLVLSPFTLFSFAADSVRLKDSGSTQVSMMAMRSIAANDGISLAAAEGNSGQFGYNIEPYIGDYSISTSTSPNFFQYAFRFFLSPGTYSFKFSFDSPPNDGGFVIGDSVFAFGSVSGNSIIYDFSLNSSVSGFFTANFNSESNFISFDGSLLTPVEGISSGYTYTLDMTNSSVLSTGRYFDFSFGSQPAGNYIVNVYHEAVSCASSFEFQVDGRSIVSATDGGVSTFIVSHGGGELSIDGHFNVSYLGGTASSSGSFSGINNYDPDLESGPFSGPISIYPSVSYSFMISDIVAIPFESAGLEQFGVFGPVIGFLRDEYASLKTFLATQIDKIAGDDETKATVDSAASELQQEVNDLNSLHGQLDSQASALEQQFTNDFAVPSEVSGQTANLQLMYSGIFSSLGVFSIFIWLPVVLAVIKKLLRL